MKNLVLMILILQICSLAQVTKPFAIKQLINNEIDIKDCHVVKMNSDSLYDLVTFSGYDSSISWHENLGNYQFNEHIISDTLKSISNIRVIDFEKDGDLDIVANHGTSTMYDEYALILMRNNGSNSFTFEKLFEYTYDCNDFEVIDLDNDGDLDIATNQEALVIYENKDNIKFIEKKIETTMTYGGSITVADFNNDGLIDIVNGRMNQLYLFTNNGNLSFTSNLIAVTQQANTIIIDFDNDGNLDIISDHRNYLKGDGTGAFTKIALNYTTTPAENSFAIAVDDFDIDGDVDIALAHYYGKKVYVARNDGEMNFTPKVICDYAANITGLKSMDYDYDGDIDLLSVNNGDDGVYLYINNLEHELLSPIETDTILVEHDFKIKWNGVDKNKHVDLQFSSDHGSNWSNIAVNTEDDGSFLWTAPVVHSSNCLIRILDTDTKSELTRLDWNFTIIYGTLKLGSPNGGVLYNEEERTILWYAEGNHDDFEIKYSIDSCNSWNLINGTIDSVNETRRDIKWTPGLDTTYHFCKIMVTSKRFPILADTSEDFITITDLPVIKILYPQKGDTLWGGKRHELKWTLEGYSPVTQAYQIKYSSDNGNSWNIVEEILFRDTFYNWVPPLIESNDCKISIELYNQPLSESITDSTFTLKPLPPQLIDEDSSIVLRNGQPYEITWKKNDYPFPMDLQYSIDNKKSWITYATGFNNYGHYDIITPDVQADSCYFRLLNTHTKEPLTETYMPIKFLWTSISFRTGGHWYSVKGGSNARLEVRFGLNLDEIKYVRYEITYDSAKTWEILQDSVPKENNSIIWSIPNIAHDTTIKVRAICLENELIKVESKRFFYIFTAPNLKFDSPQENDFFAFNSPMNIEWNWEYELDTVSISLRSTNPSIYVLISYKIENTGKIEWIVPDTLPPSNNCWIQISNSKSQPDYEAWNSKIFSIDFSTPLSDSISEKKSDMIKIGPNPLPKDEKLKIKLPIKRNGLWKFAIYDNLGNLIYESPSQVHQDDLIDLDLKHFSGKNLATGSYRIVIKNITNSGEERVYKQFIGIE